MEPKANRLRWLCSPLRDERGSLSPTTSSRTLVLLGTLSIVSALFISGVGTPAGAQAPPPAPTPPAPQTLGTPGPSVTLNPVPPTPSPSAEPRGRRGRARPTPAPSGAKTPEPTPSPTSPGFASLDGSWEVQVQYIDRTTYSYLDVQQTTNTLAGFWRYEGKKYPLEGTYDGRLIRMVAKFPQKNVTLSGYVENASDMIGLVDFGDGKTVAFTAEHRARPKPILQRR